MSSVHEKMSELSPQEKRALLTRLLKRKAEESSRFPLSFAQERLWFLDRLEGQGSTYNMRMTLRLKGLLRAAKLEQAVNEIVRRHDSLRTRFSLEQDHSVQIVCSSLHIPLPVVDLQQLAGENQSTRMMELALEEIERPFDLEKGPLIRVKLLRLDIEEHVLLVTMHHIISDAWSMNIFIHEMTVLYDAFTRGEPSPLPELPIGYVDFASWQRSWLSGSVLETQVSYWKKKLSGAPPVLELPYDYPRPPKQTFRGGTCNFDIPERLVRHLKQIGRDSGTSLFMVLLACYSILLSRYCGTEDIVVGSPIANRKRRELESLIGFFINTLVLRVDLSGAPGFLEFLGQVRQVVLEAYTHQDIPFEKLVEELKPQRNLSHSPVFQVMFVLQNVRLTTPEHPELSVTPFDIERPTAKFDLNLSIIENETGLTAELEYSADLFERDTITRMAGHFLTLLQEIASHPEQQVSRLSMLTQARQHQLLVEWNNTATQYPPDKTLHGLFTEQAEKTPHHVALIGTGGTGLESQDEAPYVNDMHITYSQLDKKSAQLAYMLTDEGVPPSPDTIVPIIIERSIEMCIGILGILKAGAAYLPIEPGLPGERIGYMLADSSARGLVTTKALARDLKADFKAVFIDAIDFSGVLSSYPVPSIHPAQLCYVIYTSGSTGFPKGVMLTHASVVNTLLSRKEEYNMSPGDISLQLFSYAFDGFVTSFFTPVISGATAVILSEEGVKDIVKIREAIVKNKVTHFISIPLLFQAIIETLAKDESTGLKVITLAGDKLPSNILEKAKEKNENLEIVNEYGVTEAAVMSTIYRHQEQDKHIKIGRPIGNTRIIILDKINRIQPIGIPGELCISGKGIARGYLNKPGLTLEKFLKKKMGTGKKCFYIYRTGDLARWLADGNIEFLGRIDYQVKVRGFRIELEEIRTGLLKHEDVKEAVVVTKENNKRDKYLCAYVVFISSSSHSSEISILREYLSDRLPHYMIPSYFVQIDEIPLTANGKVDRKALPEPDLQIVESYKPPRNNIEERLVEIWQQVLGIEQVGITDNFFETGGDSIKSIQVAARLKKYGLDMKINHLFMNPVIKNLARFVKTVARSIPQGIVEGKVELTPIQQWFFHNDFIGKHHFNQAIVLYRQGGFPPEMLQKVFEKIVEHHDALRMVYDWSGNRKTVNQWNQGLEGKWFDLEVFDFTGSDKKDIPIERKIETEANRIQRGIDLNSGPLVKLGLFKVPEGDHLLIVIHHLVVDGISWRILSEDLRTGINQLEQGEKIKFPDKTDSYKYWSGKLLEYASGKNTSEGTGQEVLKQLPYWQAIDSEKIEKLEGINHTGKISIEKRKNKYSETVTMNLNIRETDSLLKQVNRAYNTEINDILLTSLAMAINRWAGVQKVLINLEGHGRESIFEGVDISRTVGWFTSQYPVLLDIRHSDDLSYAIKTVKETLRRIPNKGIGYGILKYLKGICFTLEPEISFNYLGQFQQESTNEPETKKENDRKLIKVSRLPAGESINPESGRLYTLVISGMIMDGALTVSFTYNKWEFAREHIEQLSGSYKSCLLNIIQHCISRDKKEFTPSDLGYNKISLEALAKITQHVRNNISQEAEIESIYPLSPMQSGMFYHYLKDETSHAYFEQCVITLEGEIEKSLVENSFNQLIKQYDIFRTIFVYEDVNEPLQVVLKEREAKLYWEDITHLQQDESTSPSPQPLPSCLEDFKKKDLEKGFDLTRDLLIRLALFRTREGLYHLVWSFSHILMDGWCIGIINNRLTQIYQSLRQGKAVEPEEVTPYRRYIDWLEKQDKEAGYRYWEQYLEDYEQAAVLPKSGLSAGDEHTAYKPGKYICIIHENLSLRLNKMARKNQVTLNTVFQVLWGIVLQGYNNCNDVVFGAVVSGRSPGIDCIESMVGLLINTVPVRINNQAPQPFNQLLKSVQAEAIVSKSYEYLTLAEIQANSALKGRLIDHIMVFENYPLHEQIKITGLSAEPGFKVKNIEMYEQTNYDLNISITPGKQITVKFTYNACIYEDRFIKKIGQQIKKMIRQTVSNPDLAVKEIEIISEEEKQEILFDFNRTEADFPKHQSLQLLFMEQAGKTPDHVALSGKGIHISYKKLNLVSDQLAHVLIMKGVQADTIVGIMAERSEQVIIGILGILKAGGCYLPLDPDYPRERMNYMLKDSGVNILLTAAEIPVEFEMKGIKGDRLDVIDISDLLFLTAPNLSSFPPLPTRKGNLAYLIYTSGSTGWPKGVLIEHSPVINLVTALNQKIYSRYDHSLKVALLANFIFDASVKQVFASLLQGHQLIIIDKASKEDGSLLKDFLAKYKIDISDGTPSCLSLLIHSPASETAVHSLKQLIIGGESLSPGLVNEFYADKRNKHVIITNIYGPTESTVDASYFDCTGKVDSLIVPIGRPLNNIKLFILNEMNQFQPIGAAGEIHISGAGLARGYLNSPGLSAEKFFPFSRQQGERLYKTGDYGRWLPGWNIEFLGRLDQQVKLRGYRIELGEIETQLLKHKKIKEVVLITKKDKTKMNADYICAYFIAAAAAGEKTSSIAAELREYLSNMLPDYMIPSFFIRLERIPLTPNGKVDRKSLPQPAPLSGTGVQYVAPRNEVEKRIAALWSEVLGMGRAEGSSRASASDVSIGIDDNFFELGGHSLKVTMLVSGIHKEFQVKIPLADVFKHPSIRTLAALTAKAGKSSFTPIEKVEKKEYYNLSFNQQRLWILWQMNPQSPAYHIPGRILPDEQVDEKITAHILNHIIERHESFRTGFIVMDNDNRPVQRIREKVTVPLKTVDISALEENHRQQRREELYMEIASTPFDLAHPPLLRTLLVKILPNRYELMFNMHHIISDGWSMGILQKEFLHLYEACRTRQKLWLAPLPRQYKDFSHWQNKQLTDRSASEKSLRYWKKKLENGTPLLELPRDFSHHQELPEKGAGYRFVIPAELKTGVQQLADHNHTSLFIVLFSAFNIFLSTLTGKPDIACGIPTAGRNHESLQYIIGFFLNTVISIIQVNRHSNYREFLESLHRDTMEILQHQDYPIELVLDELNMPFPHIPVMFNMLNMLDTTAGKDLEDLLPRHLENLQDVKFDMNIYVTEYKNAIEFNWNYKKSLFKPFTIEYLAGQYVTLLTGIAGNPGKTIMDYHFLRARDLDRKWNSITSKPGNDYIEFKKEAIQQSVVSRFEEQVRKYPTNVAVKTSTDILTYEELNTYANRVAHLILETCDKTSEDKKPKPTQPAALLLGHDAEMIAGLLGALKAGNIYVPLDPYFPLQRLVYMLKDADVRIIITNKTYYHLAEQIRDNIAQNMCGISIININAANEDVADHNPGASIKPQDPAYILYTSGSTGRPKGVLQDHRNLLHFIRIYTNNLHIHPGDRLSLLSTYSFDAAVMDIYGALLNGAALYPYDIKKGDNLSRLPHWLKDEGITIYHSTPTLYRYFTGGLDAHDSFPQLRFIVLGGEAVYKKDIEVYKQHFPHDCLFINGLGPTESTVTLQYFIDKTTDITRQSIPVGYPVEETGVHLVDENDEETTVFGIGEIVYQGPYLALGYLGNPELTAGKFERITLCHRFSRLSRNRYSVTNDRQSRISADRIYRTGDLGRRLPDGSIEYVGRKDFQVKIRGVRIEPGEIESRLDKMEGIKKNAVVCQFSPDPDQENYLAAFYIPDDRSGYNNRPTIKIDENNLIKGLKKTLPDHMIPSVFRELKDFPLTPTGKIDRNALTQMIPALATFVSAGKKYIPPGNSLENTLACLWQQLLQVERVGIHDNFFVIGGNSLKAIILASNIHKKLNVKIPLTEIFKNPTVSELAEYIETTAGTRYAAVEPAEKKDYYHLSPAQKRLYFLQQLDLQSTGYNMPLMLTVHKDIDKEKLESILKEIIARHESLRTSFHMIENKPVQRIHEPGEMDFVIEIFEFQGKDAQNPDPTISASTIRSFIRPFDLSCAPLIRSGIIESPGSSLTWMIDLHHITADGTSRAVLTQDFISLFYVNDNRLEALRIQYKDFSEWQNRLIESEGIKNQVDYWMELFPGEIPRLQLAADFKRPEIFTFAGASYGFRLERVDAAAFNALGAGNGATLYMNILAALNTLFYKYTGQTDIIIGSASAGRQHADLQRIIGMFVNTLAMRNYPDGGKSYEYFLKEVVKNCIAAFENQVVQFEELVDKLELERDPGRNPLFDVSMVLQNFMDISGPEREVPISNHPDSPVPGYSNNTSKFDLTFFIIQQEEDIHINIQYYTGIFKEETIKCLATHFLHIIKTVNKEPGIKLKDLHIITADEKKQVLYEFNNTAREYPADKTITELFENQARQTPDSPAVLGMNTTGPGNDFHTLTYQELNEQSNQLAGVLREIGINSDSIVAIIVDRSIEMLFGLLGILKAGAAYLPVSPDYPAKRKEYMLKDSNSRVLLTVGKYSQQIKWNKVVLIEKEKSGRCEVLPDNLEPVNQPDDLAYVIYTSGTTGYPKGTLIEHRGVVRLVQNTGYILFEKNQRLLQTGALEFDASTFEIWGSLLNGLTLYLAATDEILIPARLKEMIRTYGIGIMWLTSPLFNRLAGEDINIFAGLRYLLVGGDVLSPVHINRVKHRFPSLNIINGYGPTENTTFSTTFPIKKEYTQSIPIGKPIANSYAYIFGKSLELQPIGVPGELCLGGAGISRGYLNNPELTSEKFVKITGQQQQMIYDRFYLSGDLCRWLPDGIIEFLGRIDGHQQVKIRGFRVEVGEIESRLLQYKEIEIKQAVVIAGESTAESTNPDKIPDKYLCAYLVSGEKIDIPGLKEYLSGSLPTYMLPSFFMQLEKIPLTPNGKVNRKALPAPEPVLDPGYTAPRDKTEEVLVNIWSDVLGIERHDISIDANFFDLGGHSLKATVLTSRIHKESGVKIPLTRVFITPFIRGLAEFIRKNRTADDIHISIEPVEKKDYYFLSPAQKRLYFLHQIGGDNNTSYNISLVLSIEGNIHIEKLEKTFKQIIARHDSLRTRFEMRGDEPVQRVDNNVQFRFAGIIGNFIRPFNLSCAPLLRVGLIKKGKIPAVLMIDMHHIITDGISQNLLIKEFISYYVDESLPALKLQYTDYSHWQNSKKKKQEIKQQKEYWLQELAGEIPVLALPADYPRPELQDFSGKRESFELSTQDVARLNEIARTENATLFMVLLALFNTFLSKTSGQEDILVGTPIAGRKHADLEQVIGMFVNMLALRNKSRGESTFIAFLKRLRQKTLEAFANQDYPFAELVEEITVGRDMSRNPLFDTVFILQNIFDRPGENPGDKTVGFRLKSYPYENKTAKFDLTLTVLEIETGKKLSFTFEYSTKIFKKETIRRFACYFKNLVSSVTRDPNQKIREIEMLTAEEKQQLLVDFNSTVTRYPRDKTIDALFEEEVGRVPDNTAIIGKAARQFHLSGKQKESDRNRDINTLTYRQLNRDSQRLARVLREKGVAPDAVVAVAVEHSVEMIIGILAILKAGGAYMPINPEYPEIRKKHLLADANVNILLTNYKTVGLYAGEVIYLPDLCHYKIESPFEKNHGSNNLAYIMHTSGSTGIPKGTMIIHRSVVRLVKNTDYIQFKTDDRLLQTGALEFDASTFEIWGALLNGLCLYPVNREIMLNSKKVKETIRKHRITTLWLTAPLFNQLVEKDIDIFSFSLLRYLLVGGDVLSPAHINKVKQAFPLIKLINGYGPTENTTFSTTHLIEKEYSGAVPIGKPIANSFVYILDRYVRLVPPGCVGELCVGGDGLSRGYLNKPELTFEKFINYNRKFLPVDFVKQNPPIRQWQKIYKTGDLARWLFGGIIEFIGRIDHQVKIRGFRVELKEIQHRLIRHHQVKEAIVLARERENRGSKFLCAYIRVRETSEKTPNTSQLKKFLSLTLPHYMIPSHFVQVDKIPLTAHGKLDVKKLETYDTVMDTGVEYAAPKTGTERIIADIWKEVLHVDKPGLNDNFFELGGNSMVLLKVSSRMREVFKRDIPVVTLFQYSTISSLSHYLSSEATGDKTTKKNTVRQNTLNSGKNRMKNFLKQSGK